MKKIILVGIMFMLFMGVVSASSINGEFEGNPVVTVFNNGWNVPVDDVPAIIYNNRTMIPIYLLKKMGATVTWDLDKYSVDVKFPTPQPVVTSAPTTNVDLEKVIIGFNETAKQYNASNVQLIFNKLGGYVSAEVNLTGNNNLDTQNIMLTSSFVAKSPAVQMFIDLYQNNSLIGFYDISRVNVESFIKKELTADEYIKSWIWHPGNTTVQPTPTPTSAPVSTSIQNAAMCSLINSKYDTLKGNSQADLISRGMGHSSYYDQEMAKIESDRKNELLVNGCTN